MQFEQLGPYRLGKKLGQGGMGTVYAGADVETGDRAAVKVLSPALAAEEGFRVRFEAEIESLKKLRHPNIVSLYGYGEQNGTLFYAMELVEGTSLEEELRRGRRFEWREVTQFGIKLCKALKHAHDHGIIHRDLKPANLLHTTDGDIKLSDFGIARLFGNTRLTSDGGVIGTAEFMSPEQAEGRQLTDRCDQYSLGSVMYALLAGRPPFRAKTLVEMLQLQRYAEPDPITRYAPQTPEELARIIHQLLEKDPARRFANMLNLARSLEAMERGLSVTPTHNDDFELGPGSSTMATGEAPIILRPSPPTAAATGTAGGDYITEATQAFQPDAASDSPSLISSTATTFTKVDPTRRMPLEDTEPAPGIWSPQTLSLLLGLLLLLAAGWYALQPPTADSLYSTIDAAAESGEAETLTAIQPKIDQFLKYYGDDPRTEEVQALADEAGRKHPAQRAFVEAKRLVLLNPEQAVLKFKALIDVYDQGDSSTDAARPYVRLARSQLSRMEKQMSKHLAQDRQLLKTRLDQAADMSATQLFQARRIYQGIIELYADKPWAAEFVAQAQAGLDALKAKESAAP